ncbi:hypothetical protein BGX30_013360 [Mortierella sp. GBA39]|nr:hypothetical protein BGX30_013360 [Mortierella sp. GBA39]
MQPNRQIVAGCQHANPSLAFRSGPSPRLLPMFRPGHHKYIHVTKVSHIHKIVLVLQREGLDSPGNLRILYRLDRDRTLLRMVMKDSADQSAHVLYVPVTHRTGVQSEQTATPADVTLQQTAGLGREPRLLFYRGDPIGFCQDQQIIFRKQPFQRVQPFSIGFQNVVKIEPACPKRLQASLHYISRMPLIVA